MKKQEKEELKEIAKIKYISTKLTGKEVAAIVGVSEVSLSKWRKEGNWDNLRAIQTIQPERLIQLALEQINLIHKNAAEEKRAILNSSEIDAISKHSKTIANLRKEIDPQTIMEVLDGFFAYLSSINLPLAQQNTSYGLDYVSSKIREKKS
jgi:transposase